jgi:hypothetical protein
MKINRSCCCCCDSTSSGDSEVGRRSEVHQGQLVHRATLCHSFRQVNVPGSSWSFCSMSRYLSMLLSLAATCNVGAGRTHRWRAPHFCFRCSQFKSQPLNRLLPVIPTEEWYKSRDSWVGIALGYGLDDTGSRFRFQAEVRNFSLHHRVQKGSGAPPASYLMGSGGSFAGGKAAGAWSWPLTSL